MPSNRTSTSKPVEEATTGHQATAVIPSQISQKKTLHWVTMARVQEKRSKQSELSEWLIDSGCSNHMTAFQDDLITDSGSSRSLVEVANESIVKAPMKGTAFIRIVEVISNKTFDTLLEDVLYVPGLS